MERWMVMAALAMLGSAATRGAEVLEPLARFLSPEMRRIDSRLGELNAELAVLPKLAEAPFASRYGFRSQNLAEQDKPQWVLIDLGREQELTRLVAMPVHIPSLGARGAGYGFPLRFRIEVADNPEMRGAVTVVDRTEADAPNPGRHPLDFRIEPATCRYVRFTSTKHFPVEEGFMWALEELVVLSGNRSVAASREIEASSSLELFPNWSIHRMVDGQSALGLPVSAEPSPTRGHLSATTSNPEERKWLRVDFGRERTIDEIRLLPVRVGNFETLGVRSFPRGWVAELAEDPAFERVVWREVKPKDNLVGYPGHCAILMQVPSVRGRYLRLVTTHLWGEGDIQGFGIAEMQAYSGNENVALGKQVDASDAADPLENAGWSPAAAVDGFASLHRILEIPEHLDLIARRGELEREAERLLDGKNRKLRATGHFFVYGGSGLGGFLAIGWAWMLIRQRTLRERAVIRLREQIARDLHDDIGSNLGGISLLGEMGASHSGDAQSREDFLLIKNAADEASASMRDIVWLINYGQAGLRDQIAKMRQSAKMILGDAELSIAVEPEEFADHRLSLLFRRHVLFAFKETLHNIRKHARATKVMITIRIAGKHLAFSVRDDGEGFDMEAAELAHHGLGNLKRRAERLGGSCVIKSSSGRGTVINFTAPLKS